MITSTALWTLHATIAGKKIAAVALRNAVRIILADKLVTAHVQQGNTTTNDVGRNGFICKFCKMFMF